MYGMVLNSDDFFQDDAEVLPFGAAGGRAAEHAPNIFPHEVPWSYKLTCSSNSFILRSHLLYNTDLMHKKAGSFAGQAGSCSGNTQSWHGLPPQIISTGGSSAPFSLVISPTWSISGK